MVLGRRCICFLHTQQSTSLTYLSHTCKCRIPQEGAQECSAQSPLHCFIASLNGPLFLPFSFGLIPKIFSHLRQVYHQVWILADLIYQLFFQSVWHIYQRLCWPCHIPLFCIMPLLFMYPQYYASTAFFSLKMCTDTMNRVREHRAAIMHMLTNGLDHPSKILQVKTDSAIKDFFTKYHVGWITIKMSSFPSGLAE